MVIQPVHQILFRQFGCEDKVNDQIYHRMKHCDLCPHQCGVDRLSGETGICGVTSEPRIYQHFVHLGEELCLIPAFIVNFAGCNLNCPDCAERHRWSLPSLKTGDPDAYAQKLAAYWKKHGFPKSLEWIGGEPSVNLDFVLKNSVKLKTLLQDECPEIYLNTNVYFSNDLIVWMKKIVDGFVFDLKCFPGCSKILVGYQNYFEVVTKNIQSIYEQWPADKLILRHLMLPGHFECCTKPVIQWCRQYVPDLTFNLMTTFHSMEGHTPEILSQKERESGIQYLTHSGLKHVLMDGEQVFSNATEQL